jgi:hypothetical protein
VEKYCRGGQDIDDDIIRHKRFACLITKTSETHSEYTYNAYCFSDATMVARTRLNVALQVHFSIVTFMHKSV